MEEEKKTQKIQVVENFPLVMNTIEFEENDAASFSE